MPVEQSLDRRGFLKSIARISVGSALCAGASTGNRRTAPKPERPNVVFILTDDQRWDQLGCEGHPFLKTPHLDRLGKRGVTFTNAYCAAPACNPSRAALMTGIRPATSGVYLNPQPWRTSPVLKDAVTIPQHFMAHGYTAKGCGKIYHGGYPDPQSWNEYYPSKTQTTPRGYGPPQNRRPLNSFPKASNFDM